MSRQRHPSLRLLSLNVNGLRSADKRRTLFRLLHRDRWDVVLLQETHHTDETEGQSWTQEGQLGPPGPTGLDHHSGAMAAPRHEESPYFSAQQQI